MLNHLLIFLFVCTFSSWTISQEKISKKTFKSPELLSAHITKNASGSEAKVDSIYVWITNNIAYDYDRLMDTKPLLYQTGSDILKNKKAICSGYVILMQEMLAYAGIQSEYVEGYINDSYIDTNYVLVEADHAWIAINIDDEWYLADPTWDAGYIGLIPKKLKTYPKRWLKEKSFSKTKKQTKYDLKLAKKKKDFDEKLAARDPYTSNVGFVKKPEKTYYLIEPDSFIVTHLPVLPEWQLKEHTLSMEQFCQNQDSILSAIENPQGEVMDYNVKIDDYLELPIPKRWLYSGVEGNKYNIYNHGVIAVHDYNYISLFFEKDVKKILKRVPDFQMTPQYELLYALCDTAIVHSKLANSNSNEAYKTQSKHLKSVSKGDSQRGKTIDKEIALMDKDLEKIQDKIVSEKTLIKENTEKTIEKIESLDKKYNLGSDKKRVETELLEKEYASLDSLVAILKQNTSAKTDVLKTTSVNRFDEFLQYSTYYLEGSAFYMSQQNLSLEKECMKFDSLTLNSLRQSNRLLKDSLFAEISTKEVTTQLKELESLIKKMVLKANTTAKTSQKVDVSQLESYLYQILKTALEEKRILNLQFSNSLNQYANYYKSTRERRKTFESLSETRTKNQEKRDDTVSEEYDKAKERGDKLYKQIISDCKDWKADLKKKI